MITTNRLGAGLPQQFQDYLQELITEIEAGRVDALDQNFPTMMVEHLQQLEPFVAEMWRRQTPTEWFNYLFATAHPDKISACDIAAKLAERQKDLELHEDIHLLKENTASMSKEGKDQNKSFCSEFGTYYDALHNAFEKTAQKRAAIASTSDEYIRKCDDSLPKARETFEGADSTFKATLADEKNNLQQLEVLKQDSECFHSLAREQIKFCKDSVDFSMEESRKRTERLDEEIKRLEMLKKAEAERMERLDRCVADSCSRCIKCLTLLSFSYDVTLFIWSSNMLNFYHYCYYCMFHMAC